VPAQKLESANGLRVGWLLASRHAVSVVHFRRAVNTQTHAKAFRLEKPAPFLIQQNSVGLYAIEDAPAGGLVFALQRDDLPKVFQANNGRFSPMPGKGNR
jgi:hypothetical protein